MDFSDALRLLREGQLVRRAMWTRDLEIGVVWPDIDSEVTRPFLYILDRESQRFPWTPNQWDMFAIDWERVE